MTERASMLKRERPVAISDCFTLAARAQLVREMERQPLDVDVEFISDW